MPHRTILLLALLAALLSPALLRAQSPRKILIEAFTNTDCGPCGEEYPIFDAYVATPRNRADVIPVSYHANFPAQDDEMHNANPQMHDGRNKFYNIGGIPAIRVNGSAKVGHPGDTAGLTSDLAMWRGLTSPITITIDQSLQGSVVTGRITVTSTVPIYNKRLHIVAVDRFHHLPEPGENGEEDYMATARAMFPDVNGSDLTLAAGESREFEVVYTVGSGWNPYDMYFVAFVQNDFTHEVLQAESNQGSMGFSSTARASALQKESEPLAWSGSFTTAVTGRYHVSIEGALPDRWRAEVRIGGATARDGDSVSLMVGAASALEVAMTPGNGSVRSGKGVVTVILDGERGTHISRTFTAYARDLTAIIIRRDEGRPELEKAYSEGMEKGSVRYAIVDRDDRDLFDLRDYPVVVYEYGSLSPSTGDLRDLGEYFDAGGRMLMIGGMIGFGLIDHGSGDKPGYPFDTAFYNGRLHADYRYYTSPAQPMRGVAGDPIGDGLSVMPHGGVANRYGMFEMMVPLGGALPVFYYGDLDHVTGLRYADGHNRMVYLTFGVEMVGDVGERGAVLDRAITWLLAAPASVPADARSGAMLGEIAPNPATGRFTVPFRLSRQGRVMIELYDMRGERAATIADGLFEAGPHAASLATAGLPAGIYTVVMSAAGERSSRMMTVVR